MDQKTLASNEREEPLSRKAEAALFAEYCAAYRRIQELKAKASLVILEMALETRRAGLLMLELRGAEQMAFPFWNEFLRTNKSLLPEGLSMGEADAQIRVARALEGADLSSVQDVRPMLQLIFQGAGLVELPHHSGPQNPSGKTPYTLFLNTVNTASVKLKEWVESEPIEDWEEECRARVAKELEPMVELYRKLKG